MKNADLTWTNMELLADARTYMAARCAMDTLTEEGLPLTNGTITTRCDEAIAFFSRASMIRANQVWVNAYRRVKRALA